MAARLGPILHVGEHLTGRDRSERERKREETSEQSGAVGGRREEERSEVERRRQEGRNVLWEEDYQEPEDAIPLRERRFTSWF